MPVRIAGHPLHPALVHFPLALWVVSILWDLVGWWQSDPLWWQMGYWCLTGGLLASLPALATGMLDFLGLRADERGLNAATAHMMAMLSATTAFGSSWILRALAGAPVAPSNWALGLALAGAALLAVGGWLGGTLVYRYGLGRSEEADGHD